MHFGAPIFLVTLAVVPLMALLALVARRRPSRYPVGFTNLEVLAAVAGPQRPRKGWFIPLGLLLVALAFAATALARPSVVRSEAQAHAVIVMLVDVSGSMQASDVAPTRIAAAVSAMQAFIGKLPSQAEVGLVEFSTEPSVVEPPTTDHSEVTDSLGLLTPGGATALGDGLATAVGVVQSTLTEEHVRRAGTADVPAAIVLLSDGAQNRGTLLPLQAAARARAAGIRVYTIAYGTPKGTIRFPGVPGAVSVAPDPVTMKAIARVTGGEMFAAETAGETSSIYRNLGSTIARKSELHSLTSWLSLGGALLLIAAVIVGLRTGSAFAHSA